MLSVPDGLAANQPFGAITLMPPIGALFPGALVSTAEFEPVTLSMTYVESLSPAGGAGGVATESLQPHEQKIIPNVFDYLRGKGVAVGPKGAGGYAGAVQIAWTHLGGPAWGSAGARTSAPAAGGGQYGLFYRSVVLNEAATGEADLVRRSNRVLVHDHFLSLETSCLLDREPTTLASWHSTADIRDQEVLLGFNVKGA